MCQLRIRWINHISLLLAKLASMLFYIEHILPQRHTPTTPVHTLTTRGRFCAVEEPLLRVLSAHCLHLMHTHRQRLCPRLLLLLLPKSPSLSSTNQRCISGPHIFLTFKGSIGIHGMLYSSTV